jgi:serine protease AprX
VRLELKQLAPWVFGMGQLRRYTQDSPVMPDVWMAYGADPDHRLDLLLEPHRDAGAAGLALALQLTEETAEKPVMELAYNQSHVAAALSFHELVRGALPLSRWWRDHLWPRDADDVGAVLTDRRREVVAGLENPMREQGRRAVGDELPGAMIWFVGIVGRIEWERRRDPGDTAVSEEEPPPGLTYELIVDTAAELVAGLKRDSGEPRTLWAVNRNRPARPAVWRSRVTVKADAATRLFSLSCRTLCWAVLDSGIDATHPAFAQRSGDEPLTATDDGLRAAGDSRIRATYDFTRLRALLATETADAAPDAPGAPEKESFNEINARLLSGRSVDWDLLLPHLEVPKDPYVPPAHEHGTHVAGVLAGDWRKDDPQGPADHSVQGVCPDMELYDLRVFDASGAGDEFAILAALQYVRWVNSNASAPVIHGVNLSLSLDHEVGAYACGRTPVCDECERLLGSGTVVVAAAGNEGRTYYSMASGTAEGYRQISITDPGNAENVITVGATHRHQPHTYGVSYFSSRGPTGDGRLKPDLVAPGEKITAPVPNLGLKSLDGTSMAAPHVSGAAALLMARHPELIGSPREVKRVLCATATDLGRERYFQGSGVVDALRAIQAV